VPRNPSAPKRLSPLLPLLERSAAEFDEIAEGERFRASEFVSWLKLEAEVPEYGKDPLTGRRDRG
jgi:hypothetical protein